MKLNMNSSSTPEEIFHAALKLPDEERSTFLESACGSDRNLRKLVEDLLASHVQCESDEFILDRGVSFGAIESNAEIAEGEGDTIGRYRLLELIGEGGMGRVYMAEQTEGLRRRVALKIIKLGMDTRQIIARFEVERQALALFDHPSITRVLDAGSTETGRPYFVMELVRGSSITDYVRGNRLQLADRLKIFVKVCRAVQHAHLKGIIHRDLKPSNILVTQFDSVPVPKVIDFGIAKAIGRLPLTDKTLFTRYAAMVGTPQYMSPEQAEMTGLDIDTRSDVYSLGVILYELITGSTPLEAKKLKQLNPLALYETLRDANIETPSVRLKKIHQSTVSLKSNACGPDTSLPLISSIPAESLRNELDWVVMKALSRDRQMRYESASDLATDIERFLAGDPVQAAPPSRFYLAKTAFRKHRAAAISTLAIASVLLVSAVTSGFLAFSNYQTSKQLANSNHQLKTTVAELKAARKALQTESENKRYRSAIKLALSQFDMELLRASEQMIRHFMVQELQSENRNEETFDATAIGFPITPLNQFQLVEFSQRELLEPCVAPIRDEIEEQEKLALATGEKILEGLQSNSFGVAAANSVMPIAEKAPDPFDTSQMFDLAGTNNIESAEESFQVNQFSIINEDKIFNENRHKFYRLLVNEYRAEFGENDPRVSPGLNLLAAWLIDQDEFNEAESTLRESKLLANDDNGRIARKLLKIVDSKRSSRRSSNRRTPTGEQIHD